MSIYDQYAIACAHLHGMTPVGLVIQTCRKLNPDLPDLPVKFHPSVLAKGGVIEMDGMVVHKSIVKGGAFEAHRAETMHKPYYIPPKDELFRYLDDNYFEKSDAFLALEAYLKKRHCRFASLLAENIHWQLFNEERMNEIVDKAQGFGLEISSEKALGDFIALVADLSNHMRIWPNNGHTPLEMHAFFEKNADEVQADLAAFLRDHGRTKFKTPPVRPFAALRRKLASTAFDDLTMEAVDALGERLDDAESFSLVEAYNLLDVCPCAYRTASAWLTRSAKADYDDLLRLIADGYERAHPGELEKPSFDFYEKGDHSYYILALDSLAALLKSKGRLAEALACYEKVLKVDLGDRMHVKEAVLVCHFGLGRMEEFHEGFEALPDGSFTKVFLALILSVAVGEPDFAAFEAAKKLSPLALAALERGEDVPDDADERERAFLFDYLSFVIASPDIRNGIRRLRAGNAEPLPKA